jgi:hypothetical protein
MPKATSDAGRRKLRELVTIVRTKARYAATRKPQNLERVHTRSIVDCLYEGLQDGVPDRMHPLSVAHAGEIRDPHIAFLRSVCHQCYTAGLCGSDEIGIAIQLVGHHSYESATGALAAARGAIAR